MATFTKEILKEGAGATPQTGQNVTVEANLYLAADMTAIWCVDVFAICGRWLVYLCRTARAAVSAALLIWSLCLLSPFWQVYAPGIRVSVPIRPSSAVHLFQRHRRCHQGMGRRCCHHEAGRARQDHHPVAACLRRKRSSGLQDSTTVSALLGSPASPRPAVPPC